MSTPPRLIGIVGTPYCGSTLLSALLDCCPGVAAVGEIDYLIRWKEFPSIHEPPVCNAHGRDCPVWSPTTRRTVLQDAELYPYVQKLFPDAETLILATKYPHLYDRFGRPDAAIVLFRRPEAWAWSTWKHENVRVSDNYAPWLDSYQLALDWCKKLPSTAVVSYAALADFPWARIPAICRHFGLRMPTRDYDGLNRLDHQFACNQGKNIRQKGIHYDCRWMDQKLPKPPKKVEALYAELMHMAI